MARHYLIRKTKQQRVERNDEIVKYHQDKYPISENEYLSIIEYFGDLSRRNASLFGMLATEISILHKIGRTRILQLKDGETFEVNQYDRTILDIVAKLIPAEVMEEVNYG